MSNHDIDGRDRDGRWKKAYCPNPNGRPRKKPPKSQSDVMYFKQTLVDAAIQGQPIQLTRHELLLHKMYEKALQGSVLIQRKLFDRFEQSEDPRADAEFHMRWLGRQITESYDKTGKLDERLYDEYRRLYYLLHGRDYLLHGREHHEAVNETERPTRTRKTTDLDPSSWRTEPKPQFILDLEQEWAEAEAAEEAERAARSSHTRAMPARTPKSRSSRSRTRLHALGSPIRC